MQIYCRKCNLQNTLQANGKQRRRRRRRQRRRQSDCKLFLHFFIVCCFCFWCFCCYFIWSFLGEIKVEVGRKKKGRKGVRRIKGEPWKAEKQGSLGKTGGGAGRKRLTTRLHYTNNQMQRMRRRERDREGRKTERVVGGMWVEERGQLHINSSSPRRKWERRRRKGGLECNKKSKISSKLN